VGKLYISVGSAIFIFPATGGVLRLFFNLFFSSAISSATGGVLRLFFFNLFLFFSSAIFPATGGVLRLFFNLIYFSFGYFSATGGAAGFGYFLSAIGYFLSANCLLFIFFPSKKRWIFLISRTERIG